MLNPANFWNFMAERYSKDPIADEVSYQHKLAKSREYFTPDSDLLEIGSGTGSTALLHAPLVKHILATDISKNMIDISNAKLIDSEIDNVIFKLSSVDELQIADESFDAVLALSLLHLVKDSDAVMAKIHKMLKPGGVFISSTVCMEDDSKIAKFITPIGRIVGLVLKPLSKKGIEQKLKNAGFSIEYSWTPKTSSTAFIIAKK